MALCAEAEGLGAPLAPAREGKGPKAFALRAWRGERSLSTQGRGRGRGGRGVEASEREKKKKIYV